MASVTSCFVASAAKSNAFFRRSSIASSSAERPKRTEPTAGGVIGVFVELDVALRKRVLRHRPHKLPEIVLGLGDDIRGTTCGPESASARSDEIRQLCLTVLCNAQPVSLCLLQDGAPKAFNH